MDETELIKMNILNEINFMMPTQAPDAIVLDGSIILIIGFLALAYLLYKHRNELFDIDKQSYVNTVDNENIRNVTDENRLYNTNTRIIDTQQNMNDVENKESEKEEDYYSNPEKEVLLNYR